MTEINTLVELYLAGFSTYAIAEKVGIPKSTVLKQLRRCGTPMRTDSDRVRRHKFNQRFFADFSVNSCYWAGLLAADGCVQHKSHHYQTTLGLKLSDEAHVRKFAAALGFDGKLYHSHLAAITLSSDSMAQDLSKNFNIVPRKSLILEPPIQMPTEYAAHFIRGYIDGDGCFVSTRPQLTVLGTKAMMSWIREILMTRCSANKPTICDKGRIFSLTYGGCC